MPLEIVRNNLLSVQADALVNAASCRPIIGHGVDSAIHKKAGPELLKARELIGEIPYGEAAATPGFGLGCKCVIHAVTPIWRGGSEGETVLLGNCYLRSLQLAVAHACESIAFPLLSSGNHGFPKDVALQTAIHAFCQFLMDHEIRIVLAVFDRNSFVLSENLFSSVKSFIDEQYVRDQFLDEFDASGSRVESDVEAYLLSTERRERDYGRLEGPQELMFCQPYAPLPHMEDNSPNELEDLLTHLDESFSQSLIRMIAQRGLTDPEVYKKANVDRKLFSKIRSHVDYKPKKTTAIAFAIALELSWDETRVFLEKAGYSMTRNNKFDVIIEYFLRTKNYNIFEINETLFAFDQPLIGC